MVQAWRREAKVDLAAACGAVVCRWACAVERCAQIVACATMIAWVGAAILVNGAVEASVSSVGAVAIVSTIQIGAYAAVLAW